MSKVMFFNVPAHGHTNPTLPLVKELVARKEEVIYYSFPEFREKIEATGATYREYKGFPEKIDVAELSSNFPYLYYGLLYATWQILDFLLEEIKREKPDYLIYDCLCPWGKYAAKITKLPAISSFSIFVFQQDQSGLLTVAEEILKLRPKDFLHFIKSTWYHILFFFRYAIAWQWLVNSLINKGDLNLLYTSREFHPHGHKFSRARYRFIGPMLALRREKKDDLPNLVALKKKGKIVYIALGTILNENIQFYQNCFEALGDLPFHMIISVGKNTDIGALGKIPKNFTVRNFVDQVKVLKSADCFITHGGMNSVHEGLYYETPLGVYPFHLEQETVARQVVETGCGIKLKSMSPENIRQAALALTKESSYRQNCKKMARSFRDAGGIKRGADIIFDWKRG